MKTRLIIDADILLYKIATQCEEATDWGDGLWTLHSDLNIGCMELDFAVEKLLGDLEADSYTMALSSSDNFRKGILPSYKLNRKQKRKPLILAPLRTYVLAKHNGVMWPSLEADDICGIMATTRTKEKRIIVSIDKDLKQIPGLLSVDGKEIITITKADADYAFMKQVLTGDAVDGYTGIPGVGEKTAEKILSDLHGTEIAILFDAVCEEYEKAGLGFDEFITQARVARILRNEDYNINKKQIKLWGHDLITRHNLYTQSWPEGAYTQ